MREVEAQAIGFDQRSLLRDVLAQHLAQGAVQEVRGRVVAADRVATLAVDVERSGLADTRVPRSITRVVHDRDGPVAIACRSRARDRRSGVDRAEVADLSAGLAVERCSAQDQLDRLADAAARRRCTVARRAPSPSPRRLVV